MILASFFGSFLLYVALGLGALVVTAALDKIMGKERALLLYAAGVVGLTWAMKPAAPPAQKPQNDGWLNGPAHDAEHRDDVVTDQKQVDDLLESLGF